MEIGKVVMEIGKGKERAANGKTINGKTGKWRRKEKGKERARASMPKALRVMDQVMKMNMASDLCPWRAVPAVVVTTLMVASSMLMVSSVRFLAARCVAQSDSMQL